ncbi:hypothetical protein BC830DRAFT_1143841, partial [Chytriomyces sp. MP71]
MDPLSKVFLESTPLPGINSPRFRAPRSSSARDHVAITNNTFLDISARATLSDLTSLPSLQPSSDFHSVSTVGTISHSEDFPVPLSQFSHDSPRSTKFQSSWSSGGADNVQGRSILPEAIVTDLGVPQNHLHQAQPYHLRPNQLPSTVGGEQTSRLLHQQSPFIPNDDADNFDINLLTSREPHPTCEPTLAAYPAIHQADATAMRFGVVRHASQSLTAFTKLSVWSGSLKWKECILAGLNGLLFLYPVVKGGGDMVQNVPPIEKTGVPFERRRVKGHLNAAIQQFALSTLNNTPIAIMTVSELAVVHEAKKATLQVEGFSVSKKIWKANKRGENVAWLIEFDSASAMEQWLSYISKMQMEQMGAKRVVLI